MIFGGRSNDQASRNDLWTLFKRPDDNWEWALAESNNDEVPPARYQVILNMK